MSLLAQGTVVCQQLVAAGIPEAMAGAFALQLEVAQGSWLLSQAPQSNSLLAQVAAVNHPTACASFTEARRALSWLAEGGEWSI